MARSLLALAVVACGPAVEVDSRGEGMSGIASVGGEESGAMPSECAPVVEGCWTDRFGAAGSDAVFGVAPTPDGGVYAVGQTKSGIVRAADREIFAARYCADGTRLWLDQFGEDDIDWVGGVAADEAGFLYVAGGFLGTSQPRAILTRYRPDGVRDWTVTQEGSEYLYGVAVGPTGSIYVAGTADEPSSPEDAWGPFDIWLARYTPEGTRQWVQRLDSGGSEQAGSIAVSSDGRLVVVGEVSGDGRVDAIAASFSTDGAQQWVQWFGTEGDDEAREIVLDRAGNAYVVGTAGEGGAGRWDGFVAKLDRDGSELWFEYIGTSEDDGTAGVVLDPDGNILVSGWVWGVLEGQTSYGSSDVYLATYAPDGTRLALRQLGTPDDDHGYAMTFVGDDLYLGGRADGPGTTNPLESDAVLIRYCD